MPRLKQIFAQTDSLYLRGRHFLLIDVVLIALSYFFSYVFRFDLGKYQIYYEQFSLFTLILIMIRLPVFYYFGLYRRLWRYASVKELVEIVFAVSVGSGLALALFIISNSFNWYPPYANFPRSIFALEWLLTLLLIGGSRFAIRITSEGWQPPLSKTPEFKTAIIIGAGDAGVALAREMQTSPHVQLTPVAFVDDDPLKTGGQIRGLPVIGSRQQIQAIATQTGAKVAIIAMPTASGKIVRETVEQCHEAGLETRIIPGIYELLDERVTVKRLRNVQLDDLLRRESRASDTTFTSNYLTGQRVLITGAGGSIGSELCRQIARYQPAQMILLGHGENSIFQIHNEIASRFPAIKCDPVIADVRNLKRLTDIFQRFNPDIVFHAAAHKHVPLMELNPSEAITNNVFGTRNVLTACEETNVQQFVLVSTDKAVRPASIMGATKRLAEILVLETAQRTGKAFVTVRFGNVLGSRGSIVPIFQNQIATGGPVTVTHPDVKRFFMTIPEATQLIIRAGALGKGGEIFVLDMGPQVKIVDLAKDLIRLSGLEVNRDIDIVFTGLRSGEKLEEELFAPDETYDTTPDERIFVIHSRPKPLSTVLHQELTALEALLQHNSNDTMLKYVIRAISNLSQLSDVSCT